MKTNVDCIISQDEAIYKDKNNKLKEKDKNNDNLLKIENKKEHNISIMNIVKENIQEENIDEKKEVNNENNKDIKDNNDEKEEDPVISHINLQELIPEEDIQNSSKLILEEIEGDILNGNKIEINAGGMVGGRGKKDGFTIFGLKNYAYNLKQKSRDEKNDIDHKNQMFSPDFELNYEMELSFPYIFSIYYKKEDKSYYIRSFSGKGSDNKILFIKLKNDDKYILKQKELISAGDSIFQITPMHDNFLEIIHLERKKHNSIKNKQIFEGRKNKIVTLGRSRDCDFSFPKDKSFSRFQTTFEFDDNIKQWTVMDGKEDKCSTNGTWIFGTHSFLIKNEIIAEILNSKISIKEIKNEDKKNEIK